VLTVYLILIECVYAIVVNVYFHDRLNTWVEGFLNAIVVSGILAPLIWQLIIKRDRTLLKQHQEALQKEVAYQHLNGKLARAFGMAETEADIVKVFKRAVDRVIPDVPVELLLADSSHAHLRIAAGSACARSGETDHESGAGHPEDDTPALGIRRPMCRVHTPQECLATRLGKSHVFEDSMSLDACPLLVDRSERSISAVCEPINIAGTTIGIIHSDIASDRVDLEYVSSVLPVIAKHLGNRLGLIRALKKANLAAMTDPLTGLLNRRSLEDRCASVLESGRRLSLVVADIDLFKNLNDMYSHAVGDRSLKVFSRTLQKICRTDDLVARLGGEEFCIVFVDLSAEEATPILKRIQKELPACLAQAGLPEFTASFGVTDTRFGDNLETLIKIADNSMYEAKKAGRNRIVLASAKSGAEEDQRTVLIVN
jgi:diguanylate cyclase (GGDEF)-like protein